MKVSIIGSTGSIGRQAIEVIEKNIHLFSVTALSANSDWETLMQQILKFKPLKASIHDNNSYLKLKQNLPPECKTEISSGEDSLSEIASMLETDTVLISTVGISGLKPVLKAIEAHKNIALATKEALVAGGNLVMALARKNNIKIRPIDSEHSAIHQCLNGQEKYLAKIILTSSGGPFRAKKNLIGITKEQVLKHPTWKMGKKITVDSASLMNKGFEVIEAAHLFNVKAQDIEVIVHPQSIIHSMVEFCDGSTLAQLSPPDMHLAIQYALSMPERLKSTWGNLDLAGIGSLTFEKPNKELFPCLELAYESLSIGKTMPAALNGANEEAVNAFLHSEIDFRDIPKIIEKAMSKHNLMDDMDIENIYAADNQARVTAKNEINRMKR